MPILTKHSRNELYNFSNIDKLTAQQLRIISNCLLADFARFILLKSDELNNISAENCYCATRVSSVEEKARYRTNNAAQHTSSITNAKVICLRSNTITDSNME